MVEGRPCVFLAGLYRADYDRDVFNGDLGVITALDLEEGELTVAFDGRPVVYSFGELDELVLAYATTIHKAQGSEYPAVVIPLSTQHYAMLARNLLYTGVTRGKQLVVLVGQRRALAIAVRSQGARRRWSKLRERLAGMATDEAANPSGGPLARSDVLGIWAGLSRAARTCFPVAPDAVARRGRSGVSARPAGSKGSTEDDAPLSRTQCRRAGAARRPPAGRAADGARRGRSGAGPLAPSRPCRNGRRGPAGVRGGKAAAHAAARERLHRLGQGAAAGARARRAA